MAVKMQTGTAITTETTVTHKELNIKGKKPNFPCMGFQSLPEIISEKDDSCRMGEDLRKRPIARSTGISSMMMREMIIHADVDFSRKSRCLNDIYLIFLIPSFNMLSVSLTYPPSSINF